MDEQQSQFFYEIFDASLPRLGPGDDASTLRALRTLLELRARACNIADDDPVRILDVGCGNGAQTLQLARHVDGTIVAVDNHRPFLDELEHRAGAEGLSGRIESRLKDMSSLGEEDGVFDLVWAEGSLFVMGFRDGLRMCFERLVPGGLAAVSESAWLLPDRPAELQEYFDAEYPTMADVAANERLSVDCGFEVVDRFVLAESAWWGPYYRPLEARLRLLREKYAAHPKSLGMVELVQAEIEMYRKYSAFYGYVFYLLRRTMEDEVWASRCVDGTATTKETSTKSWALPGTPRRKRSWSSIGPSTAHTDCGCVHGRCSSRRSWSMVRSGPVLSPLRSATRVTRILSRLPVLSPEPHWRGLRISH